MNISTYFEETEQETIKTDYELAKDLIRQWSIENQYSDIEWRYLMASSNIIAFTLEESKEEYAQAKGQLSTSKQEYETAKSRANLTAMVLLMAGRATDPDGNPIKDKFSYSAAKEVAKKYEDTDPAVIEAHKRLVDAEINMQRIERQHRAMVELSQNGKSTAQQLNREPVL